MLEGRAMGRKEGMLEGMKKGLEKGMKKGRKEGIEEGMKRAKTQIIKNLMLAGADIELVMEVTGMTREEIENLKI